MALIQWQDNFRTGFSSVDYEHQNLIALINELHDRIPYDGSVDDIHFLLGEIHALIEAHFALEEKIMRDVRYPHYRPHKDDHDRLLDDIRDIMDDVADDPDFDHRQALGERVNAWFGNHFATHDRKLHSLVPGAV